ncbi:MAG: hypothetical protein NTU61_03035 [Candidatus Altiarchaeota archaeon]|nr:hypothetical protein [Candidatus Altiarchaeota archaeon]
MNTQKQDRTVRPGEIPGDLALRGDEAKLKTLKDQLDGLFEEKGKSNVEETRFVLNRLNDYRVTGAPGSAFYLRIYHTRDFNNEAITAANATKVATHADRGEGEPPAETIVTMENKVKFVKALR